MKILTEDLVREKAGKILKIGENYSNVDGAKCGVGQLTTFNNLGFEGISDKPDGWYLPKDNSQVAIILETKNSNEDLDKKKWKEELLKNCSIIEKRYDRIVGILYNGYDVKVYKNFELVENQKELYSKEYYFELFNRCPIDKGKIYLLTKDINDTLHKNFGVKNLYHRMIFTACALVAVRYNKDCLFENMDFDLMHNAILNQIEKSLQDSKQQNLKIEILANQYSKIEMNRDKSSGKDINRFINNVKEISKAINSSEWRGEDVMGIFFNEFNRYKQKKDNGQVFTPEHITSFMYRLIDCNAKDIILDATCGSGGFLVKAMSKMIQEVGGINSDNVDEIKSIKQNQLFGIEWDKEIYALACANMLIHKDGKTNLEQMDTRKEEACEWIKSKKITKVLMNPPFEQAYGCMEIVLNVLESVPKNTLCAFILPDKKLEKSEKYTKQIFKRHTLHKIIKLPEKLFREGITTSVFVFETGVPQNSKSIVGYYIEDDGLETVKNQGRQDIRDRWNDIENYWIKSIHDGEDVKYHTKQIIDPKEFWSYQLPKKELELFEEDFIKTIMDYEMYKEGINQKDFNEKLVAKIKYECKVMNNDNKILLGVDDEKYE